MYAKALVPGSPLPVPLLVATSAADFDAVAYLVGLGWPTYPEVHQGEGTVEIKPEGGLTLVVSGVTVLQDPINPVAPDGWWDAVTRIGERVLVVVTGHGEDLASPGLGERMQSWIGTDVARSALLPVRH